MPKRVSTTAPSPRQPRTKTISHPNGARQRATLSPALTSVMSNVPSPAAHSGATSRALSARSSRSPTSAPMAIQPNNPAAPRASAASAAIGDRQTVIASAMMSTVAAMAVNRPIPKLVPGASTRVRPSRVVCSGQINATRPAAAAITSIPTTSRRILSIQTSTRSGPEAQEVGGDGIGIGNPRQCSK